ncbi:MAG: hypothetical protein IPH12_05430 [Saprospirales bacterium]|nr:hypothetical protein [Saprospirales bacterium]MBK8923056.1 hypothetical protein [Saprospirales bacterium]
MLRVYISYAPADKPYLDTLLKWLKPLQEKYFLRIWHNPFPAPGALAPYQWDDMLDQLEAAHIYLFLTSYHALSAAHIQQEEVPRAVARYIDLGENYVRVYPVLLAPSHWKKHSGLAGFAPLGAKKTLAELKPEENGYLEIVNQLELAVEKLRRNWIEEHHRLGLPVDDFSRPALLPSAPDALKPLPGWAGVVLLFALFYMITSWYFSSCAPRMYYMYTPESLPYQPLPDRYYRENPVQAPLDVPLRPDTDTVLDRRRLD